MYAVRLLSDGGSVRWLGHGQIFQWHMSEAELFSTVSLALQAVHSRGYQAGRDKWSTGSGQLQLVEIETTPREKRVVS